MNVYLEPLIDELLDLWRVITMYDSSKPLDDLKMEFEFHAIHVWTIHDVPGLTHFCGL